MRSELMLACAFASIGLLACRSGQSGNGGSDTQTDTTSDAQEDGQGTGGPADDSATPGDQESESGSDGHGSGSTDSNGISDTDTLDDGDDSGSEDEGDNPPTDSKSGGTPDTQASGDSESAVETELTPSCPEGSVPYTTSAGSTVCCSDAYPLFCDALEGGYSGGCWSQGVDCETILFCEQQWFSCPQGALSFCDENDQFSCYPCTNESRRYETLSGRPVCCSGDRPVFCDENDEGYDGGCWSEGVDCETITACGDAFTACYSGSLPYCQEGELTCYPCPEGSERHATTSGRPVCCTSGNPTFCDENEAGYYGGCWGEDMDCATIIPCNGVFGACAAGLTSSCEDGVLRCQEPGDASTPAP